MWKWEAGKNERVRRMFENDPIQPKHGRQLNDKMNVNRQNIISVSVSVLVVFQKPFSHLIRKYFIWWISFDLRYLLKFSFHFQYQENIK